MLGIPFFLLTTLPPAEVLQPLDPSLIETCPTERYPTPRGDYLRQGPMHRKRLSEKQIVSILKESAAGKTRNFAVVTGSATKKTRLPWRAGT